MQGCVALKIVVTNRLVQHRPLGFPWIIERSFYYPWAFKLKRVHQEARVLTCCTCTKFTNQRRALTLTSNIMTSGFLVLLCLLSAVVVLTESARHTVLTMPRQQVILFSAICLLFISAGSMPMGRLTEVRKRLERPFKAI